MSRVQGELTTELIDLGDCTLNELRMHQGKDLTEAVRIVLRQVERPRANLGSSGPPGRAD
ncbi:MAG: hypothetical protein ABW000_23755 [Actinoplanes sp.]